jgi:hypothetical protein
VGLAAFAALAILATTCGDGGEAAPRTLRVPGEFGTVQAAVDAAGPGDVVLVAPGRYPGGVLVPEDRPGLTIRGQDRNRVELAGGDRDEVAVEVRADGVTLENFTVHGFVGDGIEWKAVQGFTGRYLTVWNVGGYGIYAIASSGGLIEDSLASGAGDSGFYVGECLQCDTVIAHVEARLSAIGYSGTNASGVVVRDSVWDRNGTGILPNSFDQEAHPPQSGGTITGNTVLGSGTVPTPATDPLAGLTGLGIGIAGGVHNDVHDNVVTGSGRFGIAVFSTVQDDDRTWDPAGNAVRGNDVRGSGISDLALARGSGSGNCFAGNRFAKSLPERIEEGFPCDGPATAEGDRRVARELVIPTPLALARSGPRPPYTSMPEPEPQPGLPPDQGPSGEESSAAAPAAAARSRVNGRLPRRIARTWPTGGTRWTTRWSGSGTCSTRPRRCTTRSTGSWTATTPTGRRGTRTG